MREKKLQDSAHYCEWNSAHMVKQLPSSTQLAADVQCLSLIYAVVEENSEECTRCYR